MIVTISRDIISLLVNSHPTQPVQLPITLTFRPKSAKKGSLFVKI